RTGQSLHDTLPHAIDRGGDEINEHGAVRRADHSTSTSRMPARHDSALLVRVFTVPSGMWRYSATSLWDISLQYASSRTSRSFSGSSSSARCTRHETYEDSARSAGPGSPDARSGTSAAGSTFALMRSTIALRATA